MNNSKVAIAVSKLASIIQMLVGVFLLVIFGISTFMYLVDADLAAAGGIVFFVTCLVFDALGVMLVIFSRRRSKLIKEFKKYVSVICSEQTDSIASLASAMGTSTDVVKSNLELMIERNYFVNTYINQETNCIIIGSRTKNQQREGRPIQQTNTAQSQSASHIQMIQLTCKCCGGINKIERGSISECDFCGSPING